MTRIYRARTESRINLLAPNHNTVALFRKRRCGKGGIITEATRSARILNTLLHSRNGVLGSKVINAKHARLLKKGGIIEYRKHANSNEFSIQLTKNAFYLKKLFDKAICPRNKVIVDDDNKQIHKALESNQTDWEYKIAGLCYLNDMLVGRCLNRRTCEPLQAGTFEIGFVNKFLIDSPHRPWSSFFQILLTRLSVLLRQPGNTVSRPMDNILSFLVGDWTTFRVWKKGEIHHYLVTLKFIS